MKSRCVSFAAVAAFFAVGLAALAQTDRQLLRLPGATLLVGYPPSALWLTRQDQTLELQANGWGDGNVSPSMSADGRVIASGRYLGSDTPGFANLPRHFGTAPTIILSIWSADTRAWIDFPDLELGSGGIDVKLSPDGTQLVLNRAGGIQLLSLQDGKVALIRKYPIGADHLSWSSDGKHLALQKSFFRDVNGVTVPLSSICVLDLASGAVKQIGEGEMPSWSPSGEWIAFYGYSSIQTDLKHQASSVSAKRLTFIHPDGTGEKVIAAEEGSLPPLWAPDSSRMLIQWLRDEAGHMDADMVNATTGKKTMAFRKIVPVFAWVRAEPNRISLRSQ